MALADRLRRLLSGELKIWQKIAAACLVFAIPIVYLLFIYLDARNYPIVFAQKEQEGIYYLRPTRAFFEHVQQYRELARRRSADAGRKAEEVEADLRKLAAADTRYVEARKRIEPKLDQPISYGPKATTDMLGEIRKRWEDLRRAGAAADIDDKFLALSDKVRELIALVGDTSNLILDPDLDTYYLMDSVLLKLPDGQDQTARLADYAEEVIERKAATPDEKAQLTVRENLLSANATATKSDQAGLAASFKNDSSGTAQVVDGRSALTGGKLEAALAGPLNASANATLAYTGLVRDKLIAPQTPALTAEENAQAAARALEANYRLWDETAAQLDAFLQKRVDKYLALQRLALIVSAVSVLAAVALVFFIVRGFTRQIAAMQELFTQLGIGNFTARAEVVTRDELGQITGTLNEYILPLVQSREERDQTQGSIMKLLDEVAGVAEGDLTKEAEVTADVMGAVADSFNYMIAQLREIIGNVQTSTLQVSSAANEIFATTDHLARGTEQQAEQIVNTTAAIDEMAVSIAQVSENAVVSSGVAQSALANAQRGAEAVQDTIRGMGRIRESVQETAKRIKRLGESSQEIGQITQLIDDIADRTSILALNASIQAAMAGEAGRGFAVVAEEVERLAVRSTEATKKIATLVKTIQGETNEAVASMEKGIQEVVSGSTLANQAGQALEQIEAVSKQLAELIQQITLASKQQARGSEALAKSMGDISQITQQSAAGTKQAAASVNNLAALADELRASVAKFKVPGGRPLSVGHEMSVLDAPTNGPRFGLSRILPMKG